MKGAAKEARGKTRPTNKGMQTIDNNDNQRVMRDMQEVQPLNRKENKGRAPARSESKGQRAKRRENHFCEAWSMICFYGKFADAVRYENCLMLSVHSLGLIKEVTSPLNQISSIHFCLIMSVSTDKAFAELEDVT